MKYLYFFLPALLLMGCNSTPFVEFTGNIPGISTGAFVIKDKQGVQLISETILDGKFHSKKMLPAPGYYDMFITPDIIANDAKKKVFDIYLEKGAYTVEGEKDKLYDYPTIKSTSKIQNELSDYYVAASEKLHAASEKVNTISDMLFGANSTVIRQSGDYDRIHDELNKAIAKRDNVDAEELEAYVNKYPQNDVAAHLMAGMDYKKDPESFNRIYQKFSATAKNSDEGKTEADDLSQVTKMAPGAMAPKLVGQTADGKAFEAKSINKKMILIEFWRADSKVCRINHQKILNELADNKDLAIVSVSLDTKKEDWLGAVKEDKINWLQISDLKGETSPNMENWSVSTIPTYELLDSKWHFIKRDVLFAEIGPTIDDYTKPKTKQ